MIIGRNREVVVYAGGLLLQQFVTFFSAILVARWLGAADYGILSLARNVFAIALILAPLGLDLALLKHLAKYKNYESGVANSHVFWLRILVFVVNVSILLIVWKYIGSWLELYIYKYQDFSLYITLAFISLPIAADCALLTAVFRSRGKPTIQSMVTLYLQPLVRIVALVLVLWCGLGLPGVLFATFVAYLCASAVLSLILWHWSRRETAYSMKSSDRSEIGQLMRMSSWMALSVLVYSVLRNMDILILGKLEISAVVGQYAMLSTLAQLIQIFPQAFSQTLGPTVARLHLAGDITGLRGELMRYLRSASLMAGPIAACIAMFSPWFDLIVGSSFQFSAAVSSTLAAGYFVSAVFAPMGYSLSMTGHHRAEFVVLLGGTVFTALLCWFGGKFAGVLGVASAILLGFVTINLVRGILVYRVHHFVLVDRRLLHPLLISTIIAGVGKLAADHFLPYIFFHRLLVILAVCLLIFFAFWVLVFTATERAFLVEKLNRRRE